ncbi:hypothetical protein PoB_003106800 [Plakobranchus ocellatus]|uniref:Uncharacterized protein n=1 Tax=Plakobranchus ocellatus TaxID=259542 RepID=A0AAV4ACS2_9GAST|nr:hypothetical protein PoB_003106800 [Plakobranchus ocellatus]
MDQSVIHHPLEGLTQAAREHNRSLVGRIGRILPGFWNWIHRSLPPRWGDVPGGPNVIEEFKKRGPPRPRGTHPAEEAECNPGVAPGPPQACIPAGPQQPIAIDSAVASVLQNCSKTANVPLNHGIHHHRLFIAWQASQAFYLFSRLHPLRHMDFGGEAIGRQRGRRRTLGFLRWGRGAGFGGGWRALHREGGGPRGAGGGGIPPD